MIIKNIFNEYQKRFKNTPRLFNAPGRINLIGEHTDYNQGFVLPAAIDKSAVFAMNTNDQNLFRFYSYGYQEYFELKISDVRISKIPWANYLLGVIAQFQKSGKYVDGVDCVFGGNIPIGAGLSSSAAIECGFALGLNELFHLKITPWELVKMAQKAEHEYAGVLCGIMDQFTCIFGKQNQVVQLDCRSHEYHYFPFDFPEYTFVLCDTKVKHRLASSEYNKRRSECETGVSIIRKYEPEVGSLRDIDLLTLNTYKSKLDPVIYNRCKYVIEENQRVLASCKALKNNNLELVGQLMYASHEGLKNEYQVSCRELDILVEMAKSQTGVVGSRMMGGGFGGSTINIVLKSKEEDFIRNIEQKYLEKTKIFPDIYKVNIAHGASEINYH